MHLSDLGQLIEDLIAVPSVTRSERPVIEYLVSLCEKLRWDFELQEVVPGRSNIWITFGTPRVVLTTHVDVVPAPPALFSPVRKGDLIYGRGACDAKGIAATMIHVAKRLLDAGRSDFGLLFVVGEEEDGSGAVAAARDLAGAGVRVIINGEPTGSKIITAHRGIVGVRLTFQGCACHSGYPELGVDANRAMIKVAEKLLSLDYGEDPELGRASINLGRIEGGTAPNIVSPHAFIDLLVRTVGENSSVLKKIRSALGEAGNVPVEENVYNDCPVARMLSVPGFEQDIASFFTDIPNFAALKVPAVLFGPGSIHVAHTDEEHISLTEAERAVESYVKIVNHVAAAV